MQMYLLNVSSSARQKLHLRHSPIHEAQLKSVMLAQKVQSVCAARPTAGSGSVDNMAVDSGVLSFLLLCGFAPGPYHIVFATHFDSNYAES